MQSSSFPSCLCAVSVPLQPTLHASGGEGTSGPRGVPEEHEDPHGDVQIQQTQAAQEGAQPEKGQKVQS